MHTTMGLIPVFPSLVLGWGKSKVTDDHSSIKWSFAGFAGLAIGALLNKGLRRPKAMA